MKMKILITGVSGFVGSAMARYLHSVRTAGVLGADLVERDSPLAEFIRLDLLDQDRVAAVLEQYRPQTIYHLAGGRMTDPLVMLTANVHTTQVLLGAVMAVKGYRPRVVVSGSAAEYGICAGKGRIPEKMSGKVEGAYGLCKSLQTRTALYFASIGGDVVVARPFNVLGPGLPAAAAGGVFARDIVALERKGSTAGELNVGNLKAVRDFLDIRDVCSALAALANKGQAGEIYNVCSQKGVSIRQLLAQMLRLSTCRKIEVHEDLRQDPGVLSAVGSCSKLMKVTGWRPQYGFQQSVADTMAHYRSMAGARG